jgi:hypothetical protein
MDAFQATASSEHDFLSAPGVMNRYRGWFERGGGLLMAVLFAAFTVFFNYVLFVRMLHYQFEFWR